MGVISGGTVIPGALGPALFISADIAGTGAAQNTAHGMGRVPRAVFAALVDTAPATVGVATITEGVHDATNAVFTVTSGKKYRIIAFG